MSSIGYCVCYLSEYRRFFFAYLKNLQQQRHVKSTYTQRFAQRCHKYDAQEQHQHGRQQQRAANGKCRKDDHVAVVRLSSEVYAECVCVLRVGGGFIGVSVDIVSV